MKIEEAKIRFEEIETYTHGFYDDVLIKKRDAKVLLDQLDQPKLVVPQIIFDIIKKFKDENRSFYSLLENISAVKETWEWLNTPKAGAKESDLMQAWLAYPDIAVEKEKLYTVEIPNPNEGQLSFVLMIEPGGNVRIKIMHSSNLKLLETDSDFQLTEQEIRKDFEWAWQFSKEVTE